MSIGLLCISDGPDCGACFDYRRGFNGKVLERTAKTFPLEQAIDSEAFRLALQVKFYS
jgi:hypothetical protein